MSRHSIIDRPDLAVVLGFDHPLRSFFGQVFNPSLRNRADVAIAGWPTASGLGTRRPAVTHADAESDIDQLVEWALRQRWPHAGSLVWAAHIARVRIVLLREWEQGTDEASPDYPAILRTGA